jgi:hypothetical protein
MIKSNEELDNLIEHKNIIHFIRAQRLRLLSHAERMPEEIILEPYIQVYIKYSPLICCCTCCAFTAQQRNL